MRSGRDLRFEPVPVPARLAADFSAFRTFAAHGVRGHLSLGYQDKRGRSTDVTDGAFATYAGILILRGAGTYTDWNGRTYPLAAGDVFQRVPGRKHTVTIDPASGWVEGWVDVDADLARRWGAVGVLDLERAVLRPGLDLAMMERHERELIELRAAAEGDLGRRYAAIVALLIDWYARDRARATPDPVAALVEDACRLLAEGSADRALVATVARGGLSYERFRKVFRARMGVSPGAYRIRRRIDRARELLLSSSATVAAIADALGYANPFAFSAQFKQLVGVSPEQYRQRLPGGCSG